MAKNVVRLCKHVQNRPLHNQGQINRGVNVVITSSVTKVPRDKNQLFVLF